jgi:hypothetical protein
VPYVGELVASEKEEEGGGENLVSIVLYVGVLVASEKEEEEEGDIWEPSLVVDKTRFLEAVWGLLGSLSRASWQYF